MTTRVFTTTASAIAVLCLLAPAASASGEADFFKGKTITVLCPFGASGGYGRTTTLLASHFPKHIVGKPNGVPQFMRGFGGIKMLNYLYNVAPKNGYLHSAGLRQSADSPGAVSEARRQV